MLKQWKPLLLACFTIAMYTDGIWATQSKTQGETNLSQDNRRETCQGKVYDRSGEPLIGVTVLVKGTTNGTMTDVNGSFLLRNVPIGSTLQISYVGYVPVEVVWNSDAARAPLSITLQDDSQDLEEVVVVAYGTQKKVNVTGAVSAVTADVIEARPVANVQQALQGVIPGLNITTNSSGGELGATGSFNIRGQGSLNSNYAPLVLIDGIEGSLALLNPNDIESVSVLKDAASASIYGSRAAFGVILITTKSGKAGKTRVTYSGDVRFSTATNLPKMLDSYTFAQYFNQAGINNDGTQLFTNEVLEKIQKYQRGEYTDPSLPEYYGTIAGNDNRWWAYPQAFANTDWFDVFYDKNVPSTQHNISLNGGTDKVQWLISGSYLGQKGLLKPAEDKLKRYTLDAKIGAKLTDQIRIDYSTRWSRREYEKPTHMVGLFFHNIARRWPNNPVHDPNGHFFPGMELAELVDGGRNKDENLQQLQQLKVIFTPLKNWNVTIAGSMQNNNWKNYNYKLPVYNYDVNNQPYLADYTPIAEVLDNRSRTNYYTVNFFTDYTKEVNKHYMRGLLGMNYETWDIDGLRGFGKELTSPQTPYLSQALQQFAVSDRYWHRAVAGYFGRFNYSYDETYLLEVNLRYDGSSRFVGDKRWAWFPSVSTGWNIANEAFFTPFKNSIEVLKLRASWGTLGNTSSNYSSFSDWYPFFQQQVTGKSDGSWIVNREKPNTATMPSIVNTAQTWETIQTWNIGLDWNTLRGRLTGSFDWFVRNTKDMIGPAPILGSALGVNAPQENNCDMRSTGWELEVSWRDRIREVNYGVRVNLSDAVQKIIKYPNALADLSTYYEGQTLGEIWGYHTQGIASTQAEMDNWLQNNKPRWGNTWEAGDVMFKDLNGDGVVDGGNNTASNPGDRRVIGNNTPRYRLGINLDADYKGFDFGIFFQGVLKRDYMFGEGEPYFWGAVGSQWQSAGFVDHLDYWTTTNQGAYYPRPRFGSNQNRVSQTKYLQNAAYLRCKNIQLGYTFPLSLISKAKMEKCRVYVSCENLFTITKMSKIFDPEVLGGHWGAGKTYPLQRVISFGTTIQF